MNMKVKRLKGWKHGLKCTRCKGRPKPAKYIVENERYCKRCYKRLQKGLAKINKEMPVYKNKYRSWKQNRKTVTERVLRLRRRATPAEKCFNDKLEKACSVKFKFQRGFIKGGYYAIVDFYIPSRNICIEIDGGYHDSPEQQRKDKKRDKWLTEVRKQKIIRLTNKEAFDITIDRLKWLISK